ncbi:hypothetical protein N836_30880 [Leptolyngbya sp. Heron Island J]|nr:hypothetical protein N836_30880 [Leptolyngbya sp. Heron Island J]
MMTVAAVDRLVHHALIVEIKAHSYRKQAAANKQNKNNADASQQRPP